MVEAYAMRIDGSRRVLSKLVTMSRVVDLRSSLFHRFSRSIWRQM